MAKRGRPRKVEAIVTEPIGFDDIPPSEIDDEAQAVYEDVLDIAQAKEAIEKDKFIPLEELKAETQQEDLGIKIIFRAGNKTPEISFKGNITGTHLRPMILVAQLVKAYHLYRRKKRVNEEKGVDENVIKIEGSELKRVSI